MTTETATAGPFIECAACHQRIRSMHRHDFRRCRCGKTFVDGGASYLRCGGRPLMTVEGRIAVFDKRRIRSGRRTVRGVVVTFLLTHRWTRLMLGRLRFPQPRHFALLTDQQKLAYITAIGLKQAADEAAAHYRAGSDREGDME